jgi:hypothetical protein
MGAVYSPQCGLWENFRCDGWRRRAPRMNAFSTAIAPGTKMLSIREGGGIGRSAANIPASSKGLLDPPALIQLFVRHQISLSNWAFAFRQRQFAIYEPRFQQLN